MPVFFFHTCYASKNDIMNYQNMQIIILTAIILASFFLQAYKDLPIFTTRFWKIIASQVILRRKNAFYLYMATATFTTLHNNQLWKCLNELEFKHPTRESKWISQLECNTFMWHNKPPQDPAYILIQSVFKFPTC